MTGAYHELERFDRDPAFRDRLSARVAEHIKVLRRKISDRGLVRADTRLSDEVVVRVLIEHGIITAADLGRLERPGLVLPAGGPVVEPAPDRGAGLRALTGRRRMDLEPGPGPAPAGPGHHDVVHPRRDPAGGRTRAPG